MEPFWDLKIGITCVEYLTHVSSEYIISWVLLSLRSTAGRTSRVLLADVIRWINKACLVLYIARMLCAMPRLTWCSEAVEFVSCDWNLSVSRSRVGRGRLSDSISVIEAPVSMCIRTILTTFYHMNHYACSYWASGQVFIIILYVGGCTWLHVSTIKKNKINGVCACFHSRKHGIGGIH